MGDVGVGAPVGAQLGDDVVPDGVQGVDRGIPDVADLQAAHPEVVAAGRFVHDGLVDGVDLYLGALAAAVEVLLQGAGAGQDLWARRFQ